MPQFAHIPLGWSLPKRKKHLDDLVSTKGSASKYSYKLKFQGRQEPYPVYVVPLDLPKYRLENGRTQAAQEEHLARNLNLRQDFFRADKESDQAQLVQHQLLYELLSKNNLLSYFKDVSNKQTEPLILTNEGYVVNGNRRLCAMRTLFYEDQEKYGHFASIDILILPVCTPQEIDELEAYLQIQEDIKADYSWIAEACMLRARREQYGYNDEALSRIYDKSEKEIKAVFQRLSLVDEYLITIGKDKQYDLVEDKDYAFKQLQKGRQQIKDDDSKELFTQLSYALIDHSSDVTGRLYERIPSLKDSLSEIVKKIPDEIKIKDAPTPSSTKYDVLGPATIKLSPITKAVTELKDKTKIVDLVVDVIDGQKEKIRQRNKANSILKEVSEANTHLKNATNYMLEPNVVKTGIVEQISEIEVSIKALREWLSKND